MMKQTSPTNDVTRCEYGRSHFENEVVQELRLALLKYGHFTQRLQVHMQRQLCFKLVRQQTNRMYVTWTIHTTSDRKVYIYI